MKPEKQRIAIAEACGYYLAPEFGRTDLWWLCHKDHPNGIGDFKADKRFCWEYAPDYLNDLNAIHEAESYLNTEDGTLQNYHAELIHVMDCKNATWRRIHATAAQRAEAFLRAINLWEEE